jgi:hypothetical protein
VHLIPSKVCRSCRVTKRQQSDEDIKALAKAHTHHWDVQRSHPAAALALPGQYSAIPDKGRQPQGRQLLPERLCVFHALNVATQRSSIQLGIQQARSHIPREMGAKGGHALCKSQAVRAGQLVGLDQM